MSYAEITQALATADNALLHSLLEAGGAPQRASLSRDELLAALLAELTAMGVEDLLDKLSEGTKRQAQADGAAGELEDAVKRDVIAFLEAASFPLVRKMAREAGLRVSADDDVDLVRVKLFEEMVLLGTEGLLDLQSKATLQQLASAVAGQVVPPARAKLQLVEAVMIRIFSLQPPEQQRTEQARRQSGKRRPRAPSPEADAPADSAKKPRGSGRRPPKQEQEDEGQDDSGADEEADAVEADAGLTRTSVAAMRVAELRDYCVRHNLATLGLKAELVERVLTHAGLA